MVVFDGRELLVTTFNMDQLPTLIHVKAAKYQLDPHIVAAIILQESGGLPWRTRYEPGFYRRYLAHLKRKDLLGHVPSDLPTLNTEKVHRATSWGLMQVLGETARGQDFGEDDLPLLLVPETNIEIGCKYVRHLIDKDAGKTVAEHAQQTKFFKEFLTAAVLALPEETVRTMMMLLRYNGGSNLNYPHEVLRRKGGGQTNKLLGIT